jgi:hypothetical protein
MTAATLAPDPRAALDAHGFAVLPWLLGARACAALRDRFDDDAAFRKTIVMERLGYGRGVYRYFAAPVPPEVAELRSLMYARLAPVANAWAERLGQAERYPATLEEMLGRCAAPTRPGRPRCCCATGPATTTRCTRTSTARWRFRSRPRCC